ncbi:MAG: CpsD/CapB family tyrosine-protein kinase [Gallionella sp.]
MERIKQAIEKVKNQQPNAAGQFISPPPTRREETFESAIPQPLDALDEVNYNQTRIVKLRAEHLEKHRIFSFNKNDPMSVTFDVLRTQILQKMEEKGWRTLAITSPTPAVGKTVVAINLAMSVVQKTNKTAMLVDFDLRQPRIGAYLGIPLEKSLNDFLDRGVELSEILVNPDIPRLVVLPTRAAVKNPSETLSSRKVAELIKELRERYESRIIIFDLPSLLHSDDAISVLPQIDCILMVIANGMSTKREIEDSHRHLSKANLIGTVFNKA